MLARGRHISSLTLLFIMFSPLLRYTSIQKNLLNTWPDLVDVTNSSYSLGTPSVWWDEYILSS